MTNWLKRNSLKKDGTKETWVYSYNALGRRIGKGHLKNEEVSDGLEEETRFVWDGRYTYFYTDPDSYEPLAQVRNWITADGESRQQIHYFHCDQIDIPREIADKDGNLVWGLLWLGQTEERNQRNGCRCIIGKRYMYRKMLGRKKRKKCLDATVDNIKMVTAKTSYLTLQKSVSIPAVARY